MNQKGTFKGMEGKRAKKAGKELLVLVQDDGCFEDVVDVWHAHLKEGVAVSHGCVLVDLHAMVFALKVIYDILHSTDDLPEDLEVVLVKGEVVFEVDKDLHAPRVRTASSKHNCAACVRFYHFGASNEALKGRMTS